jgi:hypothetical protein
MDDLDTLLAARASGKSLDSAPPRAADSAPARPPAGLPQAGNNGLGSGTSDPIDSLLAARASGQDLGIQSAPKAVAPTSPANNSVGLLDFITDPEINTAGVLGIARGAKNIIDAGAHGLAYGYDKLNHFFGGNSDEYGRITALDRQGQQDFKNLFPDGTRTGKAANAGVVGGEIGGSLLLPEVRVMQGTTLLPRIVNGATNGAIVSSLIGDSDPNSSLGGNAAIGAGVGGAANAVLPPVIQKVAPIASKLKAWLMDETPSIAANAAPAVSNATSTVVQGAEKPRYKLNADGTATPVNSPIPPTQASVPPMPKPTVMADSGALPADQQAARLKTLQDIGLDTNRPSVITGDRFKSGTEYQTSKLDNQVGQVMRDQLAKEQAALNNYGDQIVTSTGGTAGATPTARGEAILSPLKGLSDWFDSSIDKLYAAARQKAGDLGKVSPDNLNALLSNPNFRERLLSSTDGTALLGSIDRQVARFQGTAGAASGEAPNTVQSAENLRQWLNSAWSPQNSRIIGQVKQALDLDVANAGGKDVFQAARQLHALRANTLDNPKGIASILSESGPDGINRAVPIEKVAARVVSMPDAQFGHIVDTLNGNMPQAVAPQARQALNEIRAQLAEQLVNAARGNGSGQWNAAAFNKAAADLQGKLGKVFTPAELAKIKTLHDAGFILNTPTAYPGAAAQGYNFLQQGVLTGLPSLGAVMGSAIGGGAGAGIGSAVGGATANVAKKGMDAANAARLYESFKRGPFTEEEKMRRVARQLMAGSVPAKVVTPALINALRQGGTQEAQQ